MARKITDYNGQVHAPDADYPDGDIKDNTGAGNGTYFDRAAYADIHQFFMKLMRTANVTPNALPDNEYNGFQLIEAMKIVNVKKYGEILEYNAVPILGVSGNLSPLLIINSLAGGDFIAIGDIGGNPSEHLGVIKAINKTGGSIDLEPGITEEINGGGTGNPYTLTAGKYIELVYDKPNLNWIIADLH